MGPKVVLLFVLFAPIVAFPALDNPAVLLVIPVSERACTGFLGVARVKQKRRASNASPTHYTPSQGETAPRLWVLVSSCQPGAVPLGWGLGACRTERQE
jgi:hypothetical protein